MRFWMKRSGTGTELDQFDVALLNLVQENNLLKSEQLADRVGLSATAVQRRLKRLRESGPKRSDARVAR